ncbi:MAG TPA: MarR family transcriptional regulator [Acidimicrobiales bacterium]|nr:MarR family transcriptional regulator [Acidimicrobiales bacterium]
MAPVDLGPDEERELGLRIGAAWKELRRGAAMAALRDQLFGAGEDALEPGQFDTLEALAQRRAWRMSELAEELRVDPSTATRAVQRLLRTGLAERQRFNEDGRVVLVAATETGRRRYDAIARCRRAFMASVLSGFDAEERRQFATLLERLVAAVDAAAAAGSTRSF